MKSPKNKNILKKIPKRISSCAKHLLNRENKPLLHTLEWIFVLLAFFIVGLTVILFQIRDNFLIGGKSASSESGRTLFQNSESMETFVGEVVPEPIDTTAWGTYQNKWYGFEIKRPDAWENNTQYKTATEKSARYEVIYKFRRDGAEAENVFEGYDVKIYPLKRVPNIESTNDVHKKEEALEGTSDCELGQETSFESGDLSFQKVSIKEENPCYKPAYFYSIAKGDYLYNIVPAVGESGERFSDPEKETSRLFPEYKEAVASFKLISIVRPKPAKPNPNPRIGVQRPVSAKIVNGKLVCAKKNDKPHKSQQHKGKHLDLECCLDPDEYPNPWCTY